MHTSLEYRRQLEDLEKSLTDTKEVTNLTKKDLSHPAGLNYKPFLPAVNPVHPSI